MLTVKEFSYTKEMNTMGVFPYFENKELNLPPRHPLIFNSKKGTGHCGFLYCPNPPNTTLLFKFLLNLYCVHIIIFVKLIIYFFLLGVINFLVVG